MAILTFVFDLDGVIYRGKQPVPGAVETVEHLRQLGHQVYFFTNNSTQTRTTYANRLRSMGITVDEDHIMSSAYAAALYLLERGGHGKTVLVVGEEGLRIELTAAGMKVIEEDTGEKVDYVVVGMDRQFSYKKLAAAQQAIFNGAEFIATNRDTTFPCENGGILPGAGSVVAAVATASGVEPVTMAKPETPAMLEILQIAHAVPETTVVVGDRLETDILVGKRVNAITVMVLTGISTLEDLQVTPLELQPDIVVDFLPEMLEKLGKVAEIGESA